MDITRFLTAMALEAHSQPTTEQTLDRIGHFARVAVDADDAGILLRIGGGDVQTVEGTSTRVTDVHALQAELNEGPCLDALHEGASSYRCDDTAIDPRWPLWGPRASDLGYRSVLAVRLETNDRKLGSLNAYSSEPSAFTTEDVQTLEFLAAHASVAIAASRRDTEMTVALDTRTVISQAQGMLMLAYEIDADTAFRYMRRISQDTHYKLGEVARHVVDNRHDLREHLAQDSAGGGLSAN